LTRKPTVLTMGMNCPYI